MALDVVCDVEYDKNDWGVQKYNNDLLVGLRVGDNFVVVIALGIYRVDFFIL